MEATPIKFGAGAVADAGWELKRLGVTRAMLFTDPGVAATGHPDRVREAIEAEGIEVVVYDRCRVEPTIDSFQDACDAALEAGVDGFVSVGGGTAIDTAKVADLITTHPAPVMDYVNPPVGGGKKPPSPLQPHLAIPTTSGTGSEATTVAVLDLPDLKLKSGISHRYLRPHAGDRRPRADAHAAVAKWSPRPAWTWSATPPSPSSPSPSTRARAPTVPTTARPTRARTRSPTCGRPRRSSSAAATCVAPWPTPTTPRRAAS